MKKITKYYLKLFIRGVTGFISLLLPIKRNRILFYSYGGRDYSDSPASISRYVDMRDQEFEIIWAFNNPADYEMLKDKFKVVQFNSIEFAYYYLTSRFIISNIGPMYAFKKQRKQIFINTWHGGGAYKADGMLRAFKDKVSSKEKKSVMNDVDVFLSSSKLFTEKFILESYLYKGLVLQSGLPRNDVLFRTECFENISNKVRHYFGIEENTKILLYAPTWKDYRYNYEKIDFPRLLSELKKKFNCEWSIIYRTHPLSTDNNIRYGKDASLYPDVQELLIASDILITDYSSIIWDFLILDKPCILFVPDYKQYEKSFGFYTDIYRWGGVVCENNDTLINAVVALDIKNVIAGIAESKKFFGSYEKGQGCKIVYEFLISKI